MLGVCYYPEHWPEEWWNDDARHMVEMGISHVRIGEFAWGAIEPSPDRFDWGWLDRAVAVLGRHGLKIVMGTPTAANGTAQPAGRSRRKADTSRIPSPPATAPGPGDQLALFKEYLPHPALDALREVKLDAMTPMQAFDALRKLHGLADQT